MCAYQRTLLLTFFQHTVLFTQESTPAAKENAMGFKKQPADPNGWKKKFTIRSIDMLDYDGAEGSLYLECYEERSVGHNLVERRRVGSDHVITVDTSV